MAKEKLKPNAPEAQQSSRVRQQEVLSEKSDQSVDLGFWKHEIEALQKQSFASMDEAIGAIVGAALDKMDPTMNEQDVRQFVFDMIDSDPGLKDQLASYLNLK
ncbi:MAG: hypothetical protein KDD62_11265 [Bdellovibrionales bacterium]|nr:hypothetical protein [Bdellovibrionales bacterium]